MKQLNELKVLRKNFPNDTKFGAEVSKYLDRNRTCCDDPDNLEEFEDTNIGHGRISVGGMRCRKCGEVIINRIER